MAVGENTKFGQILAEWQVPEYIKYERTWAWYFVAGSLGVAFLIYALATFNFLFAIILLLIVAIMYLHERRQPEMLDFYILEGGIMLGERFFAYKDMESFWIIYEPPIIQTVYFGMNRSLRKELPVHLEGQNPIIIRKILLNYLAEDLEQEVEATEESLARIMKI